MLRHPCRTDDPAMATAFYIPFYAGLDIARFLFVPSSAQQRDGLGKQLMEWLQEQEYWRRYGGRDHFLMIGRITWDFRRTEDEAWGSSLIYMEGMRNATRLLIERSPWDDQEMGVPYPTSFHPRSDLDVQRWQQHVGFRERRVLFAFAGGPRKTIRNDFRDLLLQQCVESGGNCSALSCSAGLCDQPGTLMELFQDAIFCLQPRGDSFTRRSAFDAILAGCIPVFFWNQSAYMQYKWHLPADDSSYSVFIPKDAVRNGISIKQVLMALPAERVARMRKTIIGLIPSIIYASPDHQLRIWKDAFDIAIDGVLSRIQSLELDPGPHFVLSSQAVASIGSIAK
ncbi:hypothetical protein O6H91_01G051400 [Diphasiastrum complanatum]|nr:hypothetical protein O6H91_01G051400 [Diphasiastrum complanatum]